MTSNTFAGSYKHTQRGTLILAVTLGLAVLFFGLGSAIGSIKSLWFAVPIPLVCAWLFHSLTITIEISERELRWGFGPGLIRTSVPLNEIVSAEPARTRLSWGIHWSQRTGWLYNVSGFDAVVVTLRGGKRFTLGTDEPQILVARLEVIQQNGPAGFKT